MKKILQLFFFSLACGLALVPLRGGYVTVFGLTGFRLSSLVGGVVFFLLSYYLLKRYGKEVAPVWIVVCMIAGVSVLELPVRIWDFKGSLISLPDILSRWGAIGFGYLFYIAKGKIPKGAVTVLFLTLFLWLAYDGYPKFSHKISFGSYTGRVKDGASYSITFQSPDGEPVRIGDFRGKYLFLDFWNSGCGNCRAAFPEVQHIYDDARNSPGMVVSSVFYPLPGREETVRTGADILQAEGYSFPAWFLDGEDPAWETLEVFAFPVVLIFGPEGELVFRGNIKNARRYIDKAGL